MVNPYLALKLYQVVITFLLLISIKESVGTFCNEQIPVTDETIHQEVVNRINGGYPNDISCFDTSEVTNMKNLFIDKDSFNADLSAWNVANVEDMEVSIFIS